MRRNNNQYYDTVYKTDKAIDFKVSVNTDSINVQDNKVFQKTSTEKIPDSNLSNNVTAKYDLSNVNDNIFNSNFKKNEKYKSGKGFFPNI